MTEFSTRVELHGADSKDYKQLHAAMDAKGFRRYIVMDYSNDKLELPTAEYNFVSDTHARQEVFNLAVEAVEIALRDNLPRIQHLNAEPMIVVTQSAGRHVNGLKPYRP